MLLTIPLSWHCWGEKWLLNLHCRLKRFLNSSFGFFLQQLLVHTSSRPIWWYPFQWSTSVNHVSVPRSTLCLILCIAYALAVCVCLPLLLHSSFSPSLSPSLTFILVTVSKIFFLSLPPYLYFSCSLSTSSTSCCSFRVSCCCHCWFPASLHCTVVRAGGKAREFEMVGWK